MPCYEAPPPYSQKANQSANEAVKILCAAIKELIFEARIVPNERTLLWYMSHREIDVEIAKDPRYSSRDEKVEDILRDIEKLKALYATHY